MATAPFTPFYSTPYTYPSSATATYPAPAYGPYSFPSTTTYPPPSYPGSYYTSPFPYAATYSYPPPASACTPAAGFTPAPAYGPSTYPCAAASPCLTSAATPIPTNAEPNWPPPPAGRPATAPLGSPDQVPGSPLPTNLSRPTPPWRDTIPADPNRESCKSQRHTSSSSFPACCYSTAPAASTFPYAQVHSPPPGSYGPNPSTPPSSTPSSSSPPPSSGTPSPPTSYPVYAAPGTPATKPPSSTHPGTPSSGGPATPSSPAHCDADLSYPKAYEVCTFLAKDGDDPASNTTNNKMQQDSVPAVLNDLALQLKLARRSLQDMNRRLEGELARRPSLTTPMVSCSASSTSTAPTPLFGFTSSGSTTTSTTSPRSSFASSMYHSATTFLAPQVFGEMPTPRSGYVNCCGHHNLIPSSCASNLSEQNLDGLPHHYGFDNLSRQSVFLADGTEHSYYALPADYPLERAVPEPVCVVYDEETEGELNEHVDVFASNPGKKPYEEDQQDSEQPLMCFSKALKTEQTFDCLNYISDLFDCTLEQHQQNDETTSVNVQQLRAPPLDVLVLHERRKKWDPGAPVILHSFLSLTACIQYIAPNDMSSALHATCFLLQRAANLSQGNCLYSLYCNSVLNTEYCTERMQWDPGVKIFLCSWLIILQEWSATDTQFPCTHITSVAAHVADVTPFLGFKANNTAGSGSRLIPMCSMKLPMNVQETSHVLKQMPESGLYEEDTSCLNCMEKQLARRLHKASNNAFSDQLRDPQLKVLVIIERRKEWDPGDTKFHDLSMTATGATKFQCTYVYRSAMVQILAVQFGARRAPIFESAIMRSYALRWTEVNVAAVLVLLVPCSKGRSMTMHSLFLSNGGTSITKRYSPKLLLQLLSAATTMQVTEQRHPLEFSIMVDMLPSGREFDGQLASMSHATSIRSPEWVRHTVTVLSRWFPSFEMAKLQWDPGIGITSSLYLWMLWSWSLWWLLYTEENTNWNKNIKCYGVALWLIHFQPP